MSSSVLLKWLERIFLGSSPELAPLPRAPLWSFGPGLCASHLAWAVQAAIHSSLRIAPADGQGQGGTRCFALFADVEKAFDNMHLPHQFDALLQAGVAPRRCVAYCTELLHSEVFVHLGDVSIGPVPHSRGKQGGCGTPFVFSAQCAAALAPCLTSWRRRGFGVPVPLPGGRVHRFCCGVFADNFVLLGEPAQLAELWTELSEKIQLQQFRWKPTSV